MKNQFCKICGRVLIPAPARFDGVPTFVGFYPCMCSEPFRTLNGTFYPGTKEHDEFLMYHDEKRKKETERAAIERLMLMG